MYFTRIVKSKIQKALLDTPILLITGPRQSGKSTLASEFSGHQTTFDDLSTLQSAKADPEGFLKTMLSQQGDKPCLIDEAQLAPEIFRPLKKIVDESKRPGMMILTGSANILSWDKMPDSLVGRMEYIPLHPLALSEISELSSHWIDDLFEGASITETFDQKVETTSLERFVSSGGFPEVFKRQHRDRQQEWINSYVHGLLEKDARDLGNIESPTQLYKVLSLLANQIGSTVNQTNLAQLVGLSRPTLSKYLTYLELLFLIVTLPPWHRNLNKRLVKSPKIYLNDTGILGFFRQESTLSGALWEQHVLCELQKQISFSKTKPTLYFYRTTEGQEVDFILEHRNGKMIAIEVKSSHQVSTSDFKGLRGFQTDNTDDFMMGIVFYRGDQILPFGENLYAIPVSCLV